MNTTIVLVVVVLIVIGVFLSDQTMKKQAYRHLAGRPELSADEFGEKYFPEHAEIASRVRNILAKHLPISLERLHPDDRPVQDLRMDDFDSMSTVEFVIDVEKEFGIKIADTDAEVLRTIRDIVEYTARQLDIIKKS